MSRHKDIHNFGYQEANRMSLLDNIVPGGQNLSDEQAEKLLELMFIAITEYGDTRADMKLRDFAEDIAMSMARTTDKADYYRKQIEIHLVD